MDVRDPLVLHATPHPDPTVRRAGFGLNHPYLEHCWSPLLGPTSVLLLRRATWLWRSGTSVAVRPADLAQGLGLGRGTGRASPFARTLERLVSYRFAAPSGPGGLDVYTEVPPLGPRQLERVPAWTQEVHENLLTRHLEALARRSQEPRSSAAPVSLVERLHRTRPAAGGPRPLGIA